MTQKRKYIYDPGSGRVLASKRAYDTKSKIVLEAKSKPCADCGRTFDPICMDFDHRPGEVKVETVSYARYLSMERLLAEIAKCDVVCACCHRLRSKARGTYSRPRTRLT